MRRFQQLKQAHQRAWAVDDFLQLSDHESGDKGSSLIHNHLNDQEFSQYISLYWICGFSVNLQKGSPVGLGGQEWFEDIGLLQEDNQTLIAEVPELPNPHANNGAYYKNTAGISHKKPRIEILEEEENFTVPDLG